MGLDTTHNAWHGPYSSFNEFRREILKAYNDTDLFEYAGYGYRAKKDLGKPSPQIPLETIEDKGIYILMNHSDCEGEITWQDCATVAESLRKIQIKLPVYYMQKCMDFIIGCLAAFKAKEDLLFR